MSEKDFRHGRGRKPTRMKYTSVTHRNEPGLSFPWIDFLPRAGASAGRSNKPYAQTYETEKENLKYLKETLSR